MTPWMAFVAVLGLAAAYVWWRILKSWWLWRKRPKYNTVRYSRAELMQAVQAMQEAEPRLYQFAMHQIATADRYLTQHRSDDAALLLRNVWAALSDVYQDMGVEFEELSTGRAPL